MELGGRILDAFPEMKVDVHKPEVLLQVEIRGDVINIYSIEFEFWRNANRNSRKGDAFIIVVLTALLQDIWLPKEVYKLKQHTSTCSSIYK